MTDAPTPVRPQLPPRVEPGPSPTPAEIARDKPKADQ